MKSVDIAVTFLGVPVTITPQTRGSILRAIIFAGRWKGTRSGIKMKFVLRRQPLLNGNRIEWAATNGTRMISGIAGTVSEAAEEIERSF